MTELTQSSINNLRLAEDKTDKEEVIFASFTISPAT